MRAGFPRNGCYDQGGMRKHDIARLLARSSHVTKAAAADQLDSVVHDILKKLKKGKTVSLPGLGTFTPGAKPAFHFDAPPRGKGSSGGKKQ